MASVAMASCLLLVLGPVGGVSATATAAVNSNNNSSANNSTTTTTTTSTTTTTATPVPAGGNNSSTTPGGEPSMDSDQAIIGAVISICGNLMISVSLNVQKFAHMKIEAAGLDTTMYFKSKLWLLGLFLTVVGEIGNFAAYMFAPASLVAPLGTVTVVSNAIIAPCFLKEVFRRRDGVGVAIALVGATLIIVFAPDAEVDMTSQELGVALQNTPFLVYASLLVVAGIGAYLYLRRARRMGGFHVALPLLVSTVCGSFTVLSVKAVSMLLRQTFAGDNQFVHPLIYLSVILLLVTAITQVKFLNEAMIHFDATAVVPTFFVMFTVGAIMIGAIFYGDFEDAPAEAIGLFAFGIMLTFVGVGCITGGRGDGAKNPNNNKSKGSAALYGPLNASAKDGNGRRGGRIVGEHTPLLQANLDAVWDADSDRARAVSFQGLNSLMAAWQQRERSRSGRARTGSFGANGGGGSGSGSGSGNGDGLPEPRGLAGTRGLSGSEGALSRIRQSSRLRSAAISAGAGAGKDNMPRAFYSKEKGQLSFDDLAAAANRNARGEAVYVSVYISSDEAEA